MQRRAFSSFTLLIAFVLFGGSLHAQHGGSTAPGNAARVGSGSGFGRQHAIRNGFFSGRPRVHHSSSVNPVLIPFWYGEPFDYQQPYPEAVMNPPVPPLIVVQPERQQSAERQIPAASPLVIDIPNMGKSARPKPRKPAIFILANGQRLESQRYTLTASNLYVTIDRQERTIPISMLEINATVAANRERGIGLRIPADRSEIFLSF
jgi:hypothetical protein